MMPRELASSEAARNEEAATVSVALCTYNGAAHLREQLDSIAAQSRKPNEVVICDDRSTDATPQIVATFAEIAPFPVRFFVNETNLGSTKNFEKALRLCQGDFIALSDQDDSWRRDRIERQLGFLQAHPSYGGVFSDGELMDETSAPRSGRIWQTVNFTRERQREFVDGKWAEVLLRNNVLTGATLMLRRSALELCLPFPRRWVHDGWIAWMLAWKSKLGFVEQPLIRYRVHESQQVGLPPASAYGKIQRAQGTGSELYASERAMFHELATYLEHAGESSGLRESVEGKMELLAFRANLPSKKSARLRGLLTRSRLYRRYSQGWQSMLKDMLLRD